MRSLRLRLRGLPLLAGALAFVASTVASSLPLDAQSAPGTPNAAATATHQHHITSGKTIVWNDPPPGLPNGPRLAVLHGDPSKAGEFTIRLKLPDATKVPPHWHPGDEHLTVIQGTFMVGTGEKYDVAGLKSMVAGDYAFMPKEMRHFALTKGETIVQVSGVGPFVINYVNPQDDPRNKKPTSNP